MSDTKNSHVFLLAGLLFLLSGATSLVYEVAWVKLLTLHMGSASWSIATVLASFMAGLGSGSAWAGRRAERFRRPLLAYGLIELGIAAFGALSAPILRYTSQLLDPLYGLIDGQFALFLVMQFFVSFFSLAIPTFLMGASLPILITALAPQDTFRQRVAVLYGINTLGAALGTLAAGVFLLPALGIVNTL
ncbi:MAG: fused MFS/spermidine synthase, partial [Gemmatimonadetes bacterium]|nr:fused MFS/spermidine synthase [Gemmatimonadota bacterium]